MLRRCSTLVALALIVMFTAPADAQSPQWTQAGMLRCVVNPSIGFIIAGHQSMECNFTPNGPLPPQPYQAHSTWWGSTSASPPAACSAGPCLLRRLAYPPARWPANMSALRANRPRRRRWRQRPDRRLRSHGSLQPVSLEGSVAIDVALGVSALKLQTVY